MKLPIIFSFNNLNIIIRKNIICYFFFLKVFHWLNFKVINNFIFFLFLRWVIFFRKCWILNGILFWFNSWRLRSTFLFVLFWFFRCFMIDYLRRFFGFKKAIYFIFNSFILLFSLRRFLLLLLSRVIYNLWKFFKFKAIVIFFYIFFLFLFFW